MPPYFEKGETTHRKTTTQVGAGNVGTPT